MNVQSLNATSIESLIQEAERIGISRGELNSAAWGKALANIDEQNMTWSQAFDRDASRLNEQIQRVIHEEGSAPDKAELGSAQAGLAKKINTLSLQLDEIKAMVKGAQKKGDDKLAPDDYLVLKGIELFASEKLVALQLTGRALDRVSISKPEPEQVAVPAKKEPMSTSAITALFLEGFIQAESSAANAPDAATSARARLAVLEPAIMFMNQGAQRCEDTINTIDRIEAFNPEGTKPSAKRDQLRLDSAFQSIAFAQALKGFEIIAQVDRDYLERTAGKEQVALLGSVKGINAFALGKFQEAEQAAVGAQGAESAARARLAVLEPAIEALKREADRCEARVQGLSKLEAACPAVKGVEQFAEVKVDAAFQQGAYLTALERLVHLADIDRDNIEHYAHQAAVTERAAESGLSAKEPIGSRAGARQSVSCRLLAVAANTFGRFVESIDELLAGSFKAKTALASAVAVFTLAESTDRLSEESTQLIRQAQGLIEGKSDEGQQIKSQAVAALDQRFFGLQPWAEERLNSGKFQAALKKPFQHLAQLDEDHYGAPAYMA